METVHNKTNPASSSRTQQETKKEVSSLKQLRKEKIKKIPPTDRPVGITHLCYANTNIDAISSSLKNMFHRSMSELAEILVNTKFTEEDIEVKLDNMHRELRYQLKKNYRALAGYVYGAIALTKPKKVIKELTIIRSSGPVQKTNEARS